VVRAVWMSPRSNPAQTVVVSSDEDQESDHGRVKPTSPSALKSSAKSHSPSKHGSTSTKVSVLVPTPYKTG
jgi:hypothetical protein